MWQCKAVETAQELAGRLLVFQWPIDGGPKKGPDTRLYHHGIPEMGQYNPELAIL